VASAGVQRSRPPPALNCRRDGPLRGEGCCSINAKLENSFLQLILDPKDGSLKTLINKKEDVKVELRQLFMAYDGKLQSSSGLYVFNPHHEA